MAPILAYPAKPMEILGIRWFKWPGDGLPDNIMYQFVEGEYMKANEYDEFLYDPSHFMATKWLPRSFKGLEGLAHFPPMRQMMWFGWLCWIWLHKGSEGFMSDEHYRKFYWPFLKRAIEGLVEKGVIPVVYCEGEDTSRLEYFAEVPPGKVIFHFAQMDMAQYPRFAYLFAKNCRPGPYS